MLKKFTPDDPWNRDLDPNPKWRLVAQPKRIYLESWVRDARIGDRGSKFYVKGLSSSTSSEGE